MKYKRSGALNKHAICKMSSLWHVTGL